MRQHNENEMTDDNYLWDASGQPDPEIHQFEQALGRFRQSRPAPVFLQIEAAPQRVGWLGGLAPRFAATAVVACAMGCALWLSFSSSRPIPLAAGWDVQVSAASGNNTATAVTSTKLRLGEALETDAASRATVAVAEVGQLEVEPMTRLRLLQSGSGRKRVALDRGTIQAVIWAPAGQFVVDTPSAMAVDMGCQYTLHVDDSGNGILRTMLGWVGFQRNGRESFIPAGAACPTNVKTGPGTPYFEDVPDDFRLALARLDASAPDSADHKAALDIVLREARERDALSLWHLLPRVSVAQRAAVYDRLAALVPPPAGVTREGVLRLDTTMLDSWWNALDLGDISLWRHWEQSWMGREGER